MLKPEGILSFITSNKWMRARYGESLRNYFIKNTNPLALIDFGGFQVFESATVDTNILIVQKSLFKNNVNTCVLGKGFSLNNMSDYFRQNSNMTTFSLESSWIVLSSIEQNIKTKIEKAGVPLKDWDINIYRGILTGYNEAFIIDSVTKDKLVESSPNSAEIIRPILRGRDIKKYNARFANQWIINTHNGIKERNLIPINAEHDYPGVFQHLEGYKDQLIKRLDKGNHWSNLRNCAYLDDFEKEKIVWIELTDHPNFALDNEGYYLNNTIFFMTGNHLKYLLAFLNSRLCEWYFDKIAATSGAGTRRWIKMYIDQICVPVPNEINELKITTMVDLLNRDFSIESYKKLDNEIYNMFKLSPAEIDLIVTAAL